jgi:MFS family permease
MEKIVNKNIKLIYLLSFFHSALFWYGVWVFYYLLFTDYAGIGLIESVMIMTLVVLEVPSGAVSDMWGKKKTLVLSFFFMVLGNVIMALAPGYSILLLAVFLLSVSSSFYSGTLEALAFDSLKENSQEKYYDQVISNISTIESIAVAIASVAGGFMFAALPALPFWSTGVMAFFGLLVVLFLKEPQIDSEKFSWRNFIEQNKQGTRELNKTPQLRRLTTLLLSIAFFSVIAHQLLNDVLAVEFGFKSHQLGILLGVLSLLSAVASQAAPWLGKHFKINNFFFLIGALIALTLIVSPYVGLVLGGAALFARVIFQVIFRNLVSVAINNEIESKYRATTLSTFNLLKNIPYIIVAYYIGYLMDLFTARIFAAGLGIILLLVLFVQYAINAAGKRS